MYIQFIYIVYTTYTQRIYIINCFYVYIVFEIMNIKVFLYNLHSSMWILKYNCLELAYLNIFIVEWSLDICSVYWSVERETSPVPVVGTLNTLQDEYCRKMGVVIPTLYITGWILQENLWWNTGISRYCAIFSRKA